MEQMGTSMSKAVFTEGVVKGLKRWRAKARKNVALRSTSSTASWSARPSLDASLETSPSLDVSPSFNTVDYTSVSLDADYPAVDVRDHHHQDNHLQAEDSDQKHGSFHGFDLKTIN